MKDIWLTELDGKSGGLGRPQVFCAPRPSDIEPRFSIVLNCVRNADEGMPLVPGA